jgi:hypothetical protein
MLKFYLDNDFRQRKSRQLSSFSRVFDFKSRIRRFPSFRSVHRIDCNPFPGSGIAIDLDDLHRVNVLRLRHGETLVVVAGKI